MGLNTSQCLFKFFVIAEIHVSFIFLVNQLSNYSKQFSPSALQQRFYFGNLVKTLIALLGGFPLP